MTLAGMLREDEDALVCDLAETYQIYDWRSLPVRTVATLAAGLRDNSRIKMIMRSETVPLEIVLQAAIADGIRQLCWLNSEDGRKNINRPQYILNTLLNKEESAEPEIVTFNSGAELEEYRRRLINGN